MLEKDIDSADDSEDFASMLEMHVSSSESLHVGQKIKAHIIAISGDSVFLDVGIKVDGIMELKDILDAEGEPNAKVGDSVDVWVIKNSAHELLLSKSMSGSGIEALEDAKDLAIPVDGKVIASCKGGYTVQVLGKDAFCPGSQIDIISGDADSYIGTTQKFLITKVESRGRNIVVSRRALLEIERQESLKQLLDSLTIGDVIQGKVTRLADFGAFVEIAPLVEGMVHISELSWSRVKSAEEVLSVGDNIQVKILAIGEDKKNNLRISLSYKKVSGDPWDSIAKNIDLEKIYDGVVVRTVSFGAFVEIFPGIDGLIHLSELSWGKRIYKAEDVVNVGDKVRVTIKDFSPDNKRISLSLRDAQGDPWADVASKFNVGSEVKGTLESKADFGLFINLDIGITGLLPNAVLKNDDAKSYNKLSIGDEVTVVIKSIDLQSKRISLVPQGAEVTEDNSWKEHRTLAKDETKGFAFGNLGQALQDAREKNKKK